MTQFFQTFTAGYAQASGISRGLDPQYMTGTYTAEIGGISNDGPVGALGAWPLVGIPGQEIVRAQLVSVPQDLWVQNSSLDRSPLGGLAGVQWLSPDITPSPILGNSGVFTWTPYNSPLASAPTIRQPTILLDGEAFLAVADDDPASVLQIVAQYRPSQMGLRFSTFSSAIENTWMAYPFGDFLDTNEGDNAADLDVFDSSNAVARLRGLFRTGNTSVTVTTQTGSLKIERCGAAFNDPYRFVWLEAGDVGPGPGQIPLAADNPTAAAIRNHPSVFFRNTPRLRGLRSTVYEVEAHDSTGNVAGENTGITERFAISLLDVTEAPTHSRWVFAIDGQEYQAVIAHPEGTDLRRPRDIYNAVVVPAIRQSSTLAAGALQTFEDITDGPDRIFRPVGELTRMNYLDYSRFIEPLNASALNIVTLISQNIP